MYDISRCFSYVLHGAAADVMNEHINIMAVFGAYKDAILLLKHYNLFLKFMCMTSSFMVS